MASCRVAHPALPRVAGVELDLLSCVWWWFADSAGPAPRSLALLLYPLQPFTMCGQQGSDLDNEGGGRAINGCQQRGLARQSKSRRQHFH